VLFKLPADRYDELAAFITERHSYDEPEIVALPIVTGSAAYLDWMREETRPAAEGALAEAAKPTVARSRMS
jgi:periplasmic divalent cation tolerance protein